MKSPVIPMSHKLARKSFVKFADSALKGDIKKLRKIGQMSDISADNPALQAFINSLGEDIRDHKGLAILFERIGRDVNVKCRKSIFGNLIYNWNIYGSKVKNSQITDEQWVPNFAVLSPSMRCNLNCRGCYSGLYSKNGELEEGEIDRIIIELKTMGCYFIVVSGGEPYLHSLMWLRLFKKHKDVFFLTYTNGTLLDSGTVSMLAKLGNVAPAISVEGFENETDIRRGEGTYKRLIQAMERLKAAGVLFGTSVTYTSKNIDIVTSDEFVSHYISQGAIFAWYFMFMPVGKDPLLELVPSPAQRYECGVRINQLRNKYPLFMADFWNDGPAAGGCLAGGRSYLHILNDGRIEPCVFAHFGVDNIKNKSVLEAVNSPFFKAIREAFPYNNNGNLMRPCMIMDNPEVLRKVVRKYVVPEGHPHSEDLIQAPDVVEWIDEYAKEYKEIVDPVWRRIIADPNNRWYCKGEEYCSLFRFGSNKPFFPGEKDEKNTVEKTTADIKG